MAELTPLKKVHQLAWRKHLLSDAGIEGQLVWREMCPAVAPGDAHNIIFAAGRSEGWKLAIEALHSMIQVDQTKNENFENP